VKGETGRPRVSYANVVATLALAVAVGTGGAYAAGLGRNDVRSPNIAPGAVKASDLAKKAVRTAKIAPGAVRGQSVASDSLTGANIVEATLGTVPGADLLDGLDSSAFLRATGRARAVLGFDPQGDSPSAPVALDLGTLTFACGNPASIGSDFEFTNFSGGPVDVWTDKVQEGFPPPTTESHTLVPNGETAGLAISGPVVASGDALLRMTIASADRVALVEARVAYTGEGCRFPLLITELHG
jgi:hypothetical protein